MKYLQMILVFSIFSLWCAYSAATVVCDPISSVDGEWRLICSDDSTKARIYQYACAVKIAIETTNEADKVSLLHNGTINANEKNVAIWAEKTFLGRTITSAKLLNLSCHAQS